MKKLEGTSNYRLKVAQPVGGRAAWNPGSLTSEHMLLVLYSAIIVFQSVQERKAFNISIASLKVHLLILESWLKFIEFQFNFPKMYSVVQHSTFPSTN